MRLIRIIRLIRLIRLIRRRNITHSVTRRTARLLPHTCHITCRTGAMDKT